MARRDDPLSRFAAAAAALLILAAVGGAFGGLLLPATGATPADDLADPRLWRIVWFTVYQAGLSALLAAALAVPLSRALARQDAFPGRAMLLRLLALPPTLPALVAVLGIVTVYGGSGWMNRLLAGTGTAWRVPLYGLAGILIAHVFFNLPLATRLLLQAWQAVPGDTWRIAAQLGMDSRAIFRQIEWPLIRRHLPAIAAFVFLLCVLSFTTVLTLGGGPAATTIEVAIYQALRFDFAPDRAAVLALVQLVLCLALLGLGQRMAAPMALGAGLARGVKRPDRRARTAVLADALAIAIAAVFIAAPLAAVALSGLGPTLATVLADAATWRALALSLLIAALSAALAAGLAAGLLTGARRSRARAAGWQSLGLVVLAVPPFVLGTGWFVLLNRAVDPTAVAVPMVVAVNALMGLPYVVRTLAAALADVDERYGRLMAGLGMSGWSRLRLVDWVQVRRPLALALGFCAALSLGDLGVIALFGRRGSETLPLLLYQRMGAYRIDEAAALAVVLAALCLAVFVASERVARD